MLNALISKLNEQLPDCIWHLGREGVSSIVIPARSQDFGDIEILDEDDELTIYFGKFTHAHFQDPSAAVDCLRAVFADELEFYGSQTGVGGFRLRGSQSQLATASKAQVWSGCGG
jgi:hypothetical protein